MIFFKQTELTMAREQVLQLEDRIVIEVPSSGQPRSHQVMIFLHSTPSRMNFLLNL
jgi:hypothetical protein